MDIVSMYLQRRAGSNRQRRRKWLVTDTGRPPVPDLGSPTKRSEASGSPVVAWLAVYPDVYYGVGNDTRASAREAFTSRSLEVQVAPEWYFIPRRLRTGPRAWFRQEGFGRLAPGGELASGDIAGVGGYASAAIG